MLGLCCCTDFSLVAESRGYSPVVVHRLLIVVASSVAVHRLQQLWLQGSRAQIHRLSRCGTQALLLCGMWDTLGSGIKPTSPTLAGRFLTTSLSHRGSPPALIFTLKVIFSVFTTFLTQLMTFSPVKTVTEISSKLLYHVSLMMLSFPLQMWALDMGKQTGFKLEKEYVKAVYCHPAYLTSMQRTSWETLGWRKYKLDCREKYQ